MAAPSMTLARVYQFWYDYIGDWIMCDVFVIIGTRWVWTAVMPEADALAHIIRHKGRVYAPRDDDSIPF